METYMLIAVVVLLCLIAWRILPGKKKPPGPYGLPIIGYIPFMSTKPYLDFQKLAEVYGNVFSIRLGSFYTVVINDFDSIKDAFARDAFMGRPDLSPFPLNPETLESKAFNGLPWKELRRFTLHNLRDLGLGKSKMEQHVQEEILDLLDHFEQEAGKPFDIRPYLSSSMSNNIASLIFGKRYPHDHPVRQKLTTSVNEIGRNAAQVGWQIFFPWLEGILKHFSSVKKMNDANDSLKGLIMAEINDHIETLDPSNTRDIIDAFLLEMPKRKDNPVFAKPILQDLGYGLFGAGSETVRVSMEWLVLTMAAYPDVQRRVQAEIDEVVGSQRMPAWPDIKNMPYTEAVISELLRWKPIIPINILRYTLTDTDLNGYFIPKHSFVIANFWSIFHDPKFWGEDTGKFRPERFLSEDGKSVKKMEKFIPFSIGRRACPGEPLARLETFLYFTSILQRFHIEPPEGKEVNFDTVLGVSLQPVPQELVLRKRKT